MCLRYPYQCVAQSTNVSPNLYQYVAHFAHENILLFHTGTFAAGFDILDLIFICLTVLLMEYVSLESGHSPC